MAAYEKREKTFTRHEYVLETPVNGTEIAKMLTAAKQDAQAVMAFGDDTLHVESLDGEIVVWWQEEN